MLGKGKEVRPDNGFLLGLSYRVNNLTGTPLSCLSTRSHGNWMKISLELEFIKGFSLNQPTGPIQSISRDVGTYIHFCVPFCWTWKKAAYRVVHPMI